MSDQVPALKCGKCQLTTDRTEENSWCPLRGERRANMIECCYGPGWLPKLRARLNEMAEKGLIKREQHVEIDAPADGAHSPGLGSEEKETRSG